MSDQAGLWYFAYGTNMARTRLVRHCVQPQHSGAAILPGYRRRFNHPGAPPLEPVYANIEPCPGATVDGVAHYITPAEAAILDCLEADYRRVPVQVYLARGEAVPAYAYQSAVPSRETLPSPRYLRLLIEGAQAHGLPPDVVAPLAALHALATDPLARRFGPHVAAPAGAPRAAVPAAAGR